MKKIGFSGQCPNGDISALTNQIKMCKEAGVDSLEIPIFVAFCILDCGERLIEVVPGSKAVPLADPGAIGNVIELVTLSCRVASLYPEFCVHCGTAISNPYCYSIYRILMAIKMLFVVLC